MTQKRIVGHILARVAARGPDYKRRTPRMSDFESQVKTEMYGERKGVRK